MDIEPVCHKLLIHAEHGKKDDLNTGAQGKRGAKMILAREDDAESKALQREQQPQVPVVPRRVRRHTPGARRANWSQAIEHIDVQTRQDM